MRLKDKTVLVTGAGGFIGSHLVEELLKETAGVKALVRYNSKHSCGNLNLLNKRLRKDIDIYFGDIRESGFLSKIVKDVDIVFNLAALVGIPYSYINPHEVVMVNIIGTLNLLKAARDAKVKKFIQTSTSEVYGSAERVPINENEALRPQSPYSASKIGSDAIALSYFYAFGLPVSIIRPFNAYGPRQSARAVIPSIIKQALRADTIELGSLTPRRDFTYVKDTVDGFIRIAKNDKSIKEVINIGSGKDVSVAEVVTLVGKLLGRKLTVVKDTKRIRPKKSEVTRLLADNSKAKRMVGWQPQFGLEEGLRLTIEFISKNLSLYDPKRYAV
jgi:dTDP-glucose 4,6-dehydratase